MEMNGAEISAIAALSGSALGGLTPIISNYLIQRGLIEREMLERELGARQSLYSDFIQFATKIYVDATTKELEDTDEGSGHNARVHAFPGAVSGSLL
jgi:hypothetical protein